jgi:hypothetical protein
MQARNLVSNFAVLISVLFCIGVNVCIVGSIFYFFFISPPPPLQPDLGLDLVLRKLLSSAFGDQTLAFGDFTFLGFFLYCQHS